MDIMRRTRAQYHRATRQVRKNGQDKINEKFAEAITENLWAEVQWVRRTNPTVSSIVDGLSQAVDIADVFASKCQELYPSVSYDGVSMDCLRNELTAQLAKEWL